MNTREIKYLSPSSISAWCKNQEAFYMKYLSIERPNREPQTQAMSVGSAFDAYIKSDLHSRLVGDKNPAYQFESLFEAQVEAHNRDTACVDGLYCFEQYKATGALGDLLKEMEDCLGVPRFETNMLSTVSYNGRSVPLNGKPDLFFLFRGGCHVVHDWKVNGYYSKAGVSPLKQYIRLFPGLFKHKECIPGDEKGFHINLSSTFEKLHEDWATQLSVYSWLLGCEVGARWVGAIDQLACAPPKPKDFIQRPGIRVAQHRHIVGYEFQINLFNKICDIWDIVTSDHIFRNMSKEDSQNRCAILDQIVKDNKEMGTLKNLFAEFPSWD